VSGSSPEHDLDTEASAAEESEISDVIRPENAESAPAAGTMRAGEAGSVSSTDQRKWEIEQGTDVIGSCGHKIGEVMDVQDDYLVVEQGFFICHDLYVPKEAISGLDKHGLHINLSKQDMKSAGWESEPETAEADPLVNSR
jgi:hypothetical protein